MKKAINILLSIAFMVSFIGVNIHMHYSHGQLYSIAFFLEAESCCADMEHREMPNMPETCNQHQEDDCSCENKTETFKLSNVFVNKKLSFISEETIDLFFISLYNTVETTMFPASFNKTNFNPSPSLVEIDVQAEFGVFLI